MIEMRIRKALTPITIPVILMTGIVLFLANGTPKPMTHFSVVGYTNVSYKASSFFKGDWLRAEVKWTNSGRTSIIYQRSPDTHNPYPTVKVETQTGWETNDQGGMTPTEMVLRPGESVVFPILLPTNTLRWQFSFDAYAATLRDRITFRTFQVAKIAGLYRTPEWMSHLLPKEVELESKLFEIDAKALTNRIGKAQ